MSAVASRTIRFHQYGEPADVLREEHADIADPPAARIRVQVVAVGLNPADWELCRGFLGGDLPRGIGLDVAGTVDAVGAGVAGVRAGDLVFGVPDFLGQPSAGAADVAVLRSWALVPAGLGAIEASVLPMPVQTAAWTLRAMGVGAGSTVLVHGAGSTVGFAAVQVARRMGARVIATAGPTYAAELERRGAAVTSYGEGMADGSASSPAGRSITSWTPRRRTPGRSPHSSRSPGTRTGSSRSATTTRPGGSVRGSTSTWSPTRRRSTSSCRSTRPSRPPGSSACRSRGPIPSPTGARQWP